MYGSLAHGDLRKESQVTKLYAKEYLQVTVEWLRRQGLESRDAATDSTRQKSEVYGVWLHSVRCDISATRAIFREMKATRKLRS